jgi:hypothetical protein
MVLVEHSPPTWALPDTAAFPGWVSDTFRYEDDTAQGMYMVQQRFVRDYLQHDSPYRGLLLYHGLGSGKTCSAIAASEALRAKGRKVIVMLPASLRGNYIREIRKCGSETFRESQSWRFDVQTAAWTVDQERGVPYDALGDVQRKQVQEQVNDAIQRTHTFINYNGISSKRVDELCAGDTNVFDDAVIVIDEVHNFVSNVSHEKLLTRVYQRIMDARRCKVVLLSGTPLVNEPHELALLVNLAHGYATAHVVTLRSSLDDRTISQLRACPDVHEFREDARTVTLRLMPQGFVRVAGGMASRSSQEDGDGMQRVRDILDTSGPGIVSIAVKQVMLLPVDPDAFRMHFVDTDANAILNADVLLRRMLGTVSFFRGHDESLYPRLRSMLIVRAPMSARQLSEYVVQRSIEIRKEEKARIVAGIRKNRTSASGNDDDSSAGYRPLSRVVCNFSYPDDVPRPRKGDASSSEEVEGSKSLVRYERALDAATVQLRDMPGRLSVSPPAGVQGLDELSPKFASIIRRLLGKPQLHSARASTRSAAPVDTPVDAPPPTSSRTPKRARGTAIVYSQFRRAEGINLLAASMESNGFTEMTVHRSGKELELVVADHHGTGGNTPRYIVYNNDDPVAAECLLAIFNNQFAEVPPSVMRGLRGLHGLHGKDTPITNLRGELAQVLLITKSGAEGITTRNVREVHVVEPFWHANRVEQVIGRARRAHSHDDLPPAERTVDVYIYMATMDTEQAKALKKDAGKTSDEFVHEVSQRKRTLLRGVYGVMRRAAVDCRFYGTNNNCFAPEPGIAGDTILYALDLDTDVRAKRPARLVAVRGDGGKMFYADPKTGVLYDHAALKERNQVVAVGRVDPAGVV